MQRKFEEERFRNCQRGIKMIKAEKGLFCSFVVLVFKENEAKKETLLNCDQIELIKLVVLNVEIIYK